MKKAWPLIFLFLWLAVFNAGCSSSSPPSSPSPSASASQKKSDSGSSNSSSGGGSSEDSAKGNVAVSGSTALQPLLTQAVSSFQSKEKFTGAVTVDGGGSRQGLLEVAEGTADIGSSVISPAQAGLDETGLVDHQVAVVSIGIAVSQDVADNLQEISSSDLRCLFAGEITDWKDVAGWKGTSLAVSVYYQEAGTGTRMIFETYGLLKAPTAEELQALPGFYEIQSEASLQKLMETAKGAVGYAAYPYCSKLSLLKIDGVEATYENVYSGKYKLWACGHLYTKGEPVGAVKSFLEYMQSSDFEKTIEESGYGLISEMKVSR